MKVKGLLLAVITAVVLAMFAAGCSDDDGEKETNNGTNGNNGNNNNNNNNVSLRIINKDTTEVKDIIKSLNFYRSDISKPDTISCAGLEIKFGDTVNIEVKKINGYTKEMDDFFANNNLSVNINTDNGLIPIDIKEDWYYGSYSTMGRNSFTWTYYGKRDDAFADTSWYSENGTSFTISTAEQLFGLSKIVNTGIDNFEGKTINLGADIMLKDTTDWINWNQLEVINKGNWVPIGTLSLADDYVSFKGTFNGNGHIVSGMATGFRKYNGFFQSLHGATIKDLGIKASIVYGGGSGSSSGGLTSEFINSTIEGCYYIGIVNGGVATGGGLIGQMGGLCEITDCFTDSDVTGYIAGGLIGNAGNVIGGSGFITSSSYTITDCYAVGNVEGSNCTGGLIGQIYHTADITNCYATGNVKSTRESAGGLVGDISVDGRTSTVNVTNCYATGNVTSINTSINSYVGSGGLIGYADTRFQTTNTSTTIINCYATGDVVGTGYDRYDGVGGLVGRIRGDIINCYAIGSVSGAENIGGLFGLQTGIHEFSYYDKETSGYDVEGRGIPKTTTEMKQQETYENWDFTEIWGITPNINDGYPYLRVFQ